MVVHLRITIIKEEEEEKPNVNISTHGLKEFLPRNGLSHTFSLLKICSKRDSYLHLL